MFSNIYWVDRLKSLFDGMIPYKVGRVIALESNRKEDKRDVISAFRKYLIATRSLPDLASGKVKREGNKVYYYIECHQPYFGIFKGFPLQVCHSKLIDSFVSSLEKKFDV